jgi:hypothetical protein
VNQTPTPGTYKRTTPVITLPDATASSLMELIKDITEDTGKCSDQHSNKHLTEGKVQCSVAQSSLLLQPHNNFITHLFLNGSLISPLPIVNEIMLS